MRPNLVRPFSVYLNQRGFLLLHITTGSSTFSPSALIQKAAVRCIFHVLEPFLDLAIVIGVYVDSRLLVLLSKIHYGSEKNMKSFLTSDKPQKLYYNAKNTFYCYLDDFGLLILTTFIALISKRTNSLTSNA